MANPKSMDCWSGRWPGLHVDPWGYLDRLFVLSEVERAPNVTFISATEHRV